MAHQFPHLADHVETNINTKNQMNTYTHYMSSLRRLIGFLIEVGDHPMAVPFDPEVMMYWIASESLRHNSVQSLTTWEAAARWYGLMLGVENDHWRQNPRYKQFRAGIKKNMWRPPVQQLPITIEFILAFARIHKLHVDNLYNVPFDLLARFTVLLWFFFTMSRPSEVLRHTQRGTDYGLELGDIRLVCLIRGDAKAYEVTVDRFKNMTTKQSVKKIYIRDPACGDPKCDKCPYLNLVRCFNIYRHRRKRLWRQALPGTRRDRLDTTNPKNAAFVLHSGQILTASKMQATVHDVVRAVGITTTARYSNYSCRIGGTTHAARTHICHSKILQYVGWAIQKLPDMAHRYTTYPPQALQWMAHDMIHGIGTPNGRHSQFLDVFDPWTAYRRWLTPPVRR